LNPKVVNTKILSACLVWPILYLPYIYIYIYRFSLFKDYGNKKSIYSTYKYYVKVVHIMKLELPTEVSIMNDHHLPRIVQGNYYIDSTIRMGPGWFTQLISLSD
jgi:hypothetical protein